MSILEALKKKFGVGGANIAEAIKNLEVGGGTGNGVFYLDFDASGAETVAKTTFGEFKKAIELKEVYSDQWGNSSYLIDGPALMIRFYLGDGRVRILPCVSAIYDIDIEIGKHYNITFAGECYSTPNPDDLAIGWEIDKIYFDAENATDDTLIDIDTTYGGEDWWKTLPPSTWNEQNYD